MYVCMYVCVYVCMYVCMYVGTCIPVYTYGGYMLRPTEDRIVARQRSNGIESATGFLQMEHAC